MRLIQKAYLQATTGATYSRSIINSALAFIVLVPTALDLFPIKTLNDLLVSSCQHSRRSQSLPFQQVG